MGTNPRPTIDDIIPVPLPTPEEARALRLRVGVTGTDLARVVGVTPASIYAWETGTRNPNGEQRKAYADALAELDELDEGKDS